MAHRRVVCSFPSQSGFPRDSVVNVLHFTTGTPSNLPSTTVELQAIRDAVSDFYQGAHDSTVFGGSSAAAKVVGLMTSVILVPTLTIKIYRCETEIAAGASPEPIITYDVAIVGMGVSQPHPEEVACCLSFRTNIDPTIAVRRQRGRLYIGPLSNTGLVVVNGRTAVSAGVRGTLAAAGAALKAQSTAGIDWVVWSHAQLSAFPVTAGWVDDAFDTQRRRGPKPAVRTAW